MSKHQSAGHNSTEPIALVSIGLALTLVLAFVMAAFWAVDRIDTRELVEERQNIAAALSARKERIAIEQDSSAIWDDAVLNLRADNQPWIAENLIDWMSEYHLHDRVYAIAPDGQIVRAAELGTQADSVLDTRDRGPVEALAQSLRQQIVEISGDSESSTTAITGLGLTETVRLADGQLAFVSVRPIVPTSETLVQAPGTEFLHASVVLLNEQMLNEIGEQFGLPDLRVGSPDKGRGTLPVLSTTGRVIGFVVWSPRKPALVLIQETAPAILGLLLLGGTSLFGLLFWLRRTTRELAESQAQIEFLAFHDPLTGVANRALFEVRLQEALEFEYLAKAKVALVCIDLDKFKEVNDTLGHSAGDQLIQQAARRLSMALAEGATLTRLGGDEFAVVQPGVVSDGHTRFLCQTLLDTFQDPFLLAGEYVQVTASLGVAIEAGDATSAAEMMRCADVALYAAKAAGRNCFYIYDTSLDQSRREKRTLEIELRNALLTGEGLYLVYQPIFDANTGTIVSAEALVRWEHKQRGYMTPDKFIGVAEEQGVIDQLGMWVLEEACRYAASSRLSAIAVNVSPLQFNDPDLADRILCVLEKQKLSPQRLELEITEGLLLQNLPNVQAILSKLRAHGVRIALDDFGTGYSSISYLRHHSIDKLKVDRSFTKLIGRDKVTDAIVRSIVEMAQALGMVVTAEGVEDDLQRHGAAKLGCSTLQGYLLSRPVAGEHLEEMLALQHVALHATKFGHG
jgi:diguanylate cyclase (GGDEF)-like protein